MIRKIFLDLGAHIGESVHYFRKHYGTEHEIFCFDPLPENIEQLNQIDGIMVMPYAVSDYAGVAKFYIGLPQSGSLSDQKRTGGLDGDSHINVKVLDFAYWLRDFIWMIAVDGSSLPCITVKMNIEGAEYEVLDKLSAWGLLSSVNKWYIQWHWKKIGLDKAEHDRISSLIEWEPWGAMFE